jgi:hypothetical protein
MFPEVVLEPFQALSELQDALSQRTSYLRQALSKKQNAKDKNHQNVKGTERPFEKSKSWVHEAPLCF